MEGSDAFAQPITDEDDPFAGSDLDFETDDGHAAAVPTVDREGREVQPPAEDPTPAGPDPTPPPAPAGPTDAGSVASDPTPASSPEPQASGDGGGEEPRPTPAAPPAAATGEATGPSAGATSSSPGSGAPDEEEAPPPEETTRGGKTVKRRYLIYRVDEPGKLTQVSWYEDAKGKLVKRGEGRLQRVCLSRDTEGALKFGYAAVGAPAEGATLVAVAQLHFQPRKIKPLPPEPLRQRLSIS